MARADAGRSYLIVPVGGAGEGMGHLVRCLKLSEQLGSRVSILTRHLDSGARKLLSERLSRFPKKTRPAALPRVAPTRRWDLVVIDGRRTAAGEVLELMEHGLVACLDEGGEARTLAPFILDSLPGLPGRPVANLAHPSFLFLPPRSRHMPPASLKRVLVCIGGEDREHLGEKLANSLVRTGAVQADRITVVQGPLAGNRTWPDLVKVIQAPSGLVPTLRKHDLLVTHFGMAAFEALAVGVPVVLFNPTSYHERLGAIAGFSSIGIGAPVMRRLRKLIKDPSRLQAQVEEFNETIGALRGRDLPRVLRSLTMLGSSECPVCRLGGNTVIARFHDRTYRRCRNCGLVFLESFAGTMKVYDAGYFSSEYKAQYGRTYLEDFTSIQAASRPRVAIVRQLMGRGSTGFVLDVGCAYGPFLAALGEAGLPCFGLDVSPGAVSYVKKNLGLPALCAGFEDVPRACLPRSIGAVTLWYVLEHFPETNAVLTKAAGLLTEGGVLAFSTPNGRGISARRALRRFLQNSPGDHFTIFSPRRLGAILARYGCVLKRVRVTGHHPERFPGLLGRAAAKWRVAAGALRAVSVVLRLGDTFEAYAVKGEA